MAHVLQLDINNHRYQLVNSAADGVYLIEINSQRRLLFLLSILLLLLGGYLYQLFTAPEYSDTHTARVQQVILEKHLGIDLSVPVETHQHPVYLYYDKFDLVKTFLPERDMSL